MVNWICKNKAHRVGSGVSFTFTKKDDSIKTKITFYDKNSKLAKSEYISVGYDEELGRIYFRPSDEKNGFKTIQGASRVYIMIIRDCFAEFAKQFPFDNELFFDKTMQAYYVELNRSERG